MSDKEKPVDNQLSKEEALAICSTFVSHFRKRGTIADQRDVSRSADSTSMVIPCGDSRMDGFGDLVFPKGTEKGAFHPGRFGNAIGKEPDLELLGLLEAKPEVDNVIILGHSRCAAKAELYNALLMKPKDRQKMMGAPIDEGNLLKRHMMITVPENLEEALKQGMSKNGFKPGKSPDPNLELHFKEAVARASLLQSIINLHEQIQQHSGLAKRIENGSLKISCAIRSLSPDVAPEDSLVVYVPKLHNFQNLSVIYEQAGKPSITTLEEPAKITVETPADSSKAEPSRGEKFFKKLFPGRYETPEAPRVNTVGLGNISDLNTGLAAELHRITQKVGPQNLPIIK